MNLTNCVSSEEDSDFDPEDLTTVGLVLSMVQDTEDRFLSRRGYLRIKPLNSKGNVYLARVISAAVPNATIGSTVVIKSADRWSLQRNVVQKDDGCFLTDKSVQREAEVLQIIANLRHPTNRAVKLVESFASAANVYLVTSYVANTVPLRRFIDESHALMRQKQLSAKQYHVAIRTIMKQVAESLCFLHGTAQCCHLDITTDNILIEAESPLAALQMPKDISVVLCDFAASNVFTTEEDDEKAISFKCDKFRLNVDNEAYVLPDMCDGMVYDARAADLWGFGMVLHECMAGQPLYKKEDRWMVDGDVPLTGFSAIILNKLPGFLRSRNLSRWYNDDQDCMLLLASLLNTNQKDQIDAFHAVQHTWLADRVAECSM